MNMLSSKESCTGQFGLCLLHDVSNGARDNSLERLAAVVAWSLSTTRPSIFGFAPYNQVLGETHHVSTSGGGLNVLLEQVSHHLPVTALHATNAHGEMRLVWCQSPTSRFHGASVEVAVRGARELRLSRHAKTYAVGCPNLVICFLPSPGVEWAVGIS